MTIAGINVRRRIFVSLGLLIIATGFWVFWARAHRPKVTDIPRNRTESFVKIIGTGQEQRNRLIEERAEFFDPTPLFLPTERNFQQGPLPSRILNMKQPGQVFRDFEPKWHFVEATLPDYGAPADVMSGNLVEMLAWGIDAPFAGFGRLDKVGFQLERRSGFLEVKSLKTGELSLAGTIEKLDLPKVDYSPAEFLVVVASAGLIGDPILLVTSTQDEVDVKLKDYLVRIYRVGERLAPGRYHVLIGP